MFTLLFAQIAHIQVVAADRIANQPGNAARQIRAEYQTERGRILAADGVTIMAESVPAPEGSAFGFERRYPQGVLYGHITGYYSRLYGRSGLEQAMNPYLSGTAPEFAAANLSDLILGRPKVGGTVVTTIVPRTVLRAAWSRDSDRRPDRRHPGCVVEPRLRPNGPVHGDPGRHAGGVDGPELRP
jgi:peptidoglycan glycosyltransferase